MTFFRTKTCCPAKKAPLECRGIVSVRWMCGHFFFQIYWILDTWLQILTFWVFIAHMFFSCCAQKIQFSQRRLTENKGYQMVFVLNTLLLQKLLESMSFFCFKNIVKSNPQLFWSSNRTTQRIKFDLQLKIQLNLQQGSLVPTDQALAGLCTHK